MWVISEDVRLRGVELCRFVQPGIKILAQLPPHPPPLERRGPAAIMGSTQAWAEDVDQVSAAVWLLGSGMGSMFTGARAGGPPCPAWMQPGSPLNMRAWLVITYQGRL